jgi:hypothetical protein
MGRLRVWTVNPLTPEPDPGNAGVGKQWKHLDVLCFIGVAINAPSLPGKAFFIWALTLGLKMGTQSLEIGRGASETRVSPIDNILF